MTFIQSRNDIKVLDLGSNKVKLHQQIQSTEMGGGVAIESKGREASNASFGKHTHWCATSGRELCIAFTVKE